MKYRINIIVERAKRARHSQVCSIENRDIMFIGRAKRAPHWGVQSRFRVIYYIMYIIICMSVCLVCQINCVGGITWTKHAHAQSLFFLAVKPVTPVLFISYTLEL